MATPEFWLGARIRLRPDQASNLTSGDEPPLILVGVRLPG